MSNNFTSFDNYTKEETIKNKKQISKKTTINKSVKKEVLKVTEVKQNKSNIKNIINELNSPMTLEIILVFLMGGALITGAILMVKDVEEKRNKHEQEMQEIQEKIRQEYLDY